MRVRNKHGIHVSWLSRSFFGRGQPAAILYSSRHGPFLRGSTNLQHPFVIREDDLTQDETRQLLRLHLEGMHANSPPGSVFALDLSGLKVPEVTVWTLWIDETIAGIGALKALGNSSGEIKSMRTHPRFLRCGVAAALLDHIIGVARARGWRRLSLETGSGPAFEPALRLYRGRGFIEGGAFADYEKSAFNQFLHLTL